LDGLFSEMSEITTILTILLGWLLGLLTPGFAERIRRPYRRRDLIEAVIDEMLGLQFTMAMVAYMVRARRADVSTDFLDEILRIAEGYHGPDRNEDLIEAIKKIRGLSEEERAALHQAKHKPEVGMALRQYSVPLFATQVADLTICSRDFQRSVLHIRYHLELFNQIVPDLKSLFEKTYNNPNPQDRAALIANQEVGYRDAGKRAEIIMRAIGDLQKKCGPSKKMHPICELSLTSSG